MSEKTIADKMYLKTAKSLAVFNGAVHPGLVAQLPQELIDAGGAQAGEATGVADAVLLFALSHNELARHLPDALQRLGDKGSLWIAYLKQSAPKATDLTRDAIDAYAKQFGVSTVAMISMDADWSALRLKRL